MRILFIGGTGIISSAAAVRAQSLGHEVTLLNRGSSAIRPVPSGVEVVTGDVRDPASVRNAIGDRMFDVVVDFVAFTPEQVQGDIDLFSGRTGQYVFISSASAYAKPVPSLPIRESSPLRNPFWQYSRDKIACERLLRDEHAAGRIRVTVVRPSHTYDRTQVPLLGGWTAIDRMRRGLPIVLHGDGTSPWAITHSDDFATAFVHVLGAPEAIGEAFNIMSPELLTWNSIALDLADAAGVEVPHLVHRTTHDLVQEAPVWDEALRGDRSHAAIFDTSKIESLAPGWAPRIPFAEGARRILAWHDADASRRVVDRDVDALYDRLTA